MRGQFRISKPTSMTTKGLPFCPHVQWLNWLTQILRLRCEGWVLGLDFQVRFAFSCFHFMALSTGATLPLHDDACRGGHGKGQSGGTLGEFLELWEWRLWRQSCMDGFGASVHCTVHDSKRSWLLSTRHETSSLSGNKTQLLLCCLYFCTILALLGMKWFFFHTN